MTSPILWPVKRREYRDRHINSEAWNGFKFRDGDIVIATYAKSGTTWLQQIVAQLLFGGAEGIVLPKVSPWVDFRLLPPEALMELEAQAHRRFMKTHLAVDALVFSPKAKYLYVGRDGRDVAWSFYNHHANHTDEFFDRINGAPGDLGPPFPRAAGSAVEFYRGWLAGDGHPYWPFWENVRSWWAIRDLPNVLLVHFADIKADLAGSIRRIAQFLDVRIDEAKFAAMVDHCGFDYMKAHAEIEVPRRGASFVGGARTFFHQGANGRWRDALTPGDVEAYERRAVVELGPECAAWLAKGAGGG